MGKQGALAQAVATEPPVIMVLVNLGLGSDGKDEAGGGYSPSSRQPCWPDAGSTREPGSHHDPKTPKPRGCLNLEIKLFKYK